MPNRLTFDYQAGRSMEFRLESPDEEDLRSLLLSFRLFIMQREPTHVPSIVNLCHRLLAPGQLLDALTESRSEWKKEMRSGRFGFVVNDERIAPEDILDWYVNGHYFHSDPDKLARLKRLGPPGAIIARFQFQSALSGSIREVLRLGLIIREGLSGGHFRFRSP